MRTNRKCLTMPFKPDQEGRLLRARKTLLIDPVVVCAHVSIYQRADEVEIRKALSCGEHFIHRLLSLSGGEAHQQRSGLSPPQSLARSPLGKARTEDLSSRTLSQQA